MLPFIAGIAMGAGAALLFTKRKKVKEALNNSAVCENIQKSVQVGLDRGKEFSTKALQYAKDNFNSLTSARDSIKESKRTNKAAQTTKKARKPRATKTTKKTQETKITEGNL
ncbi:hypothetical protein [Helicobacter rodentium]|uniref:hypothetical protein n=1 Tax=Helicobacter rodentium TaxID=59617 RepID=UPI00047ACB17|nr:hypothetical protein [Helicobacter rodentium]